jgi:hypothetical protein
MKSKIFLGLLLSLCFSQNTFAEIGAVSSATGGTGRGAVEPVDGVLLNPATITDLPHKYFSVNYSADAWALTVSDNGADSLFPAGLEFIKTTTTAVDTQQLGISFSTPRWKKIAIGGTVSMLEYTNFVTTGTEQKYRQTTFDLGATVAVSKNFGFGIVATKMASSSIDLPENLQIQKTMGAGISYTYQNFARLRFDVISGPNNTTDKLVYGVGFENYINDWLVFRLGYKTDNVVVKDYFTAGLGFAGPQFGLHYAYISNVSDKKEDKHLIDLSIPF